MTVCVSEHAHCVYMWIHLCMWLCSYTSEKCDKWWCFYTHTHHTYECVWVYVCMLMCLRKHLNMSKWVCVECVFVTVFMCEWMYNYVDVQVNPWAYSSVLVRHYTPMSECVSMFMCECVCELVKFGHVCMWACVNVSVFMYVNVKPCVNMCLCVSEWVILSVFMWMSTYVRVFVCINMQLWLNLCMCVSVSASWLSFSGLGVSTAHSNVIMNVQICHNYEVP